MGRPVDERPPLAPRTADQGGAVEVVDCGAVVAEDGTHVTLSRRDCLTPKLSEPVRRSSPIIIPNHTSGKSAAAATTACDSAAGVVERETSWRATGSRPTTTRAA